MHAFVNYAHRGASEYTPENTFLAFYTGLYMGANGIETDVQRTKDGVLVLFHDDTVTRLTGDSGSISDYTLEELQRYTFSKNGLTDKIVTVEDFLRQFAWRDLTFAIEIKQPGIEQQLADLLRRYGMQPKTVITSFIPDAIRAMRAYAPDFQIGLLTEEITDDTITFLKELHAEEICPNAPDATPENVARWHQLGFRVRAWGVKNEALMRAVCEAGADGMTVNFPDKLTAYLRKE